jgi:UDP-glucose 4-epimerase
MIRTCLVTGGLGFIGSHICVELLSNNYDIIIIDNLSNSKIEKLNFIKKFNIHNNKIFFYNIDLLNYNDLENCLNNYINLLFDDLKKIDMIIHLAGYKAVGESIKYPETYYQNNILSTLNIILIMKKFNINNLIFSSSSTIYGNHLKPPYDENMDTGIDLTNPYAKTKYFQEEILKDLENANKSMNIVILRYFNPIGSLNSDFKEEPKGIPNNLFPYLLKVYNGELDELVIFGSDYNTRDGTCTRDFIHVVDLAKAHIVCCENILMNKISGLKIYNVGTGKDVSVLELIKTFENINNTKINYKFGPKRSGDLESSFSNVDLIYKELGWKTKFTIEDCVKI